VLKFDWMALRKAQLAASGGKLFDVICMDPPW